MAEVAPKQPKEKEFRPYIAPEASLAEFTPKAILLGAVFGILFGAATVYLALKAGLTVSASIPIAVIAISLGRKLFKTTILENNIIQTTGSAGESIAAGVVFTLPGFLFLSMDPGTRSSVGAGYFSYVTLFVLSLVGGILGVLMMIPLRRSLIVKEHGQLVYPEGAACASVLIAGDKGGDFAKTAFQGVGFALAYAVLQKIVHVIAEAPAWVTAKANKFLPNATVNGEITPEYLGVGYIIGPRIAGVLVAGGVLAWLGLIPLLSVLVSPDVMYAQLVKVGSNPAGFGWDAATHTFADMPDAVYRAYVRQIGAGAVAAGGFITLLKTFPTIWASLRDSIRSLGAKGGAAAVARTERDLSFVTVIVGSVGLVVLLVLLPQVPGDTVMQKLLVGLLIIAFGFIFVTVSSRIVGIIGSSSNPISGMTIATLMATAMVFVSVGWTGAAYEPMALVVGGMVCIAAANAGATSQDLKTGYIVGATPWKQQVMLAIGTLTGAAVIAPVLTLLQHAYGFAGQAAPAAGRRDHDEQAHRAQHRRLAAAGRDLGTPGGRKDRSRPPPRPCRAQRGLRDRLHRPGPHLDAARPGDPRGRHGDPVSLFQEPGVVGPALRRLRQARRGLCRRRADGPESRLRGPGLEVHAQDLHRQAFHRKHDRVGGFHPGETGHCHPQTGLPCRTGPHTPGGRGTECQRRTRGGRGEEEFQRLLGRQVSGGSQASIGCHRVQIGARVHGAGEEAQR